MGCPVSRRLCSTHAAPRLNVSLFPCHPFSNGLQPTILLTASLDLDRDRDLDLQVGITDRCKMLDYEAAVCRPFNFPLLTPSFFTSNDAYVGIKFRYFRSLVQWLLSLNGVTVSASSNGGAIVAGQHIDDEDAAAASCVLLEQCKTIGVPLGGGLSPVRIRSGYGEAVLSLLDALLEHTIAHQGVVLLPPVHSTEDDIVRFLALARLIHCALARSRTR
eukprot:2773395-Rhodomonas_salina.3